MLDEIGRLRSPSASRDIALLELSNDNHLLSLVYGLACDSKIILITSVDDNILWDAGGCSVQCVNSKVALRALICSSL